MITEQQRDVVIQGIAQTKQWLETIALKGGQLDKQLDRLKQSLDADFDYQVARSILQTLSALKPDEERGLGSTEPEGHKTLRDILNEIVNARDAHKTSAPKP
jgi:hypothetical protein